MLELILEYAASWEDWELTRNLRCVSKRWRSLSFKGLCQSYHLPKLWLGANALRRFDSLGNMSLITFKEKFPTKCPRNLELSKPLLPFQLRIQRFPTKSEFKYIRKMAFQIAAVSIERLKTSDSFGESDTNNVLTNNLQLPNLRFFYVSWQGATGDQLFRQLVQYFQRSSKRVSFVRYKYPKKPFREDWPIAPANITHISYTGTIGDIQKLTSGIAKTLTGLQLTLKKENLLQLEDSAILNGIVQRHSKTLWILEIRQNEEVFRGDITLNNMTSLKGLTAEVPIRFEEIKPKLRHMECTIGVHPPILLASLETLRNSSSSLEYLCLNWEEDMREVSTEGYGEIYLSLAREIVEPLPNFTMLTKLRLQNFLPDAAMDLLPKVYESMTNITDLSLHFEGPETFLYGETDLSWTLTRVGGVNIPADELLWPQFLINRACSITSLKSR